MCMCMYIYIYISIYNVWRGRTSTRSSPAAGSSARRGARPAGADICIRVCIKYVYIYIYIYICICLVCTHVFTYTYDRHIYLCDLQAYNSIDYCNSTIIVLIHVYV